LGVLLAVLHDRFGALVPLQRAFVGRRAGHSSMLHAIQRRGGTGVVSRYLHADPSMLIPYMIAIAAQTFANAEALRHLRRDCMSEHLMFDGRVVVGWSKGRATRVQRRSFLRDRTLSVPNLIDRVLALTEVLVPHAPKAERDRLFLCGEVMATRRVVLIPDYLVSVHVRRFVKRHDLRGADGKPLKLNLAALRATGLTLAHEALGYDLLKTQALPDALGFDPFPYTTAGLVAGVSRATRGAIPFIPDAVALDLMSKALHWVERETDGILEQRDRFWSVFNTARSRGVTLHYCGKLGRDALRTRQREPNAPMPAGRCIATKNDLDRCLKHLTDACFIVIAGFVGMRASEILSIRTGAIEYRQLGTTGVSQAYVVGRLFKTAEEGGRLERWLAPDPVVTAAKVLERVSEPLRMASGRDELFLTRNTQYGQVVGITNMHINDRIREFAAVNNVRRHGGQPWRFSTHQFRKTFARFIARRDRSQLLALADHLKHVSVAMTAKGYVGTDFDLQQLVDHEGQIETATALDRFLSSDRLAGKMGERIAAGNASFRGRAGEQVRRDYINMAAVLPTEPPASVAERDRSVLESSGVRHLPGFTIRTLLLAPASRA